MKKTSSQVPAWRITMQYRLRNGFVYEVEKSGTSVAFHISRADTGEGTDREPSWQVAAHDGRRREATVSESAGTRSEALSKVASAWRQRTPDLRLPTLDWDVIANALRNVHAI